VKSAAFKYLRADCQDDAVAALQTHGDDLKVLAGGQSLLTLMNFRIAQPEILLDIGRAGLTGIARNGSLEIGAMTTQNQALISQQVRESTPLMVDALRHVGHHTLRNRGTVGGSIAHADPSAELPAVLLAAGGEVVAASARGPRTIAAEDFFESHYTTALEDDELLTAVRLPARAPDAHAFHEVTRRHGDFAIAGMAATFTVDATDRVTEARIALFSVDERPVRLAEVEHAVVGRALGDPEAAHEAATRAAQLVEPIADIHGSTAFRKRVTEVVVRRGLTNVTRSRR
jgi:carbon-monoxide dehydrogenase medium subunit